MDTIFAQATAPGRAGVSVVRISGPTVREILVQIAGSAPKPRHASLREICDSNGELIDRSLVLFFEGPHSFTGEDVAELHLHGSIAVVQSVLDLLGTFGGTRLAEAGEFTRRALENDKIDLTQAEGLADLIEAETGAQRKQALKVVSGKFKERVERWRAQLIRAASLVEATIDFADEDIPIDVTDEVDALLRSVLADLKLEIDGTLIAERVKTGFEVAIVGAPNVGKSTLLNALAGRDAAITSSTAGTTRDIVEVRMNLSGLPVTFLDTAGLRDTADEVEQLGIKRAISRAESADMRVFLTDGSDHLSVRHLDDDIIIKPKADLMPDDKNAVSGLTGQGIDALVGRIKDVLSARVATIGLATHQRHRVAMKSAVSYLDAARQVLSDGPDLYDIAAAELGFAIRALEVLVGRVDVESLLDEIFSSFCVGK
ncbi:tRNA uridine-5-carboxymethylaminomethyl(34) synthesis GTPase MnmE [Sulfitobacter aestuariivivens]|uniref:tRNA modification GTPase MnmE n=1 Tax=Sulfitobacter aestuariivivens TaxID=2766981 RepID=A0A927HHG2_9RHOB|nr:tRNA uridine-5-carboxymethylaminomethyl(34) synthesis GTPase MnmE [Sulfitobacter aestuariivivens]MBD3665230.1 tRNA uridine-5-carboxymethylaminomethyl(34) synthesis GTPase MnmE [Sulfitobacter aestuariivivens]